MTDIVPPLGPDQPQATDIDYIITAGAIIGGALGGLAGLALGAGLIWFLDQDK